MAAEPFTAVGRIAKTHGLKGEVSVIEYTDTSLDALVGLDAWLVPPVAAVRSTRLMAVRPGPKGPIVTLEGVDSIDVARGLGGREILVSTDALPEGWDRAPEPDMAGVGVVDEIHGDLGEIVEVIVTGANDVWVVDGPKGQVLIPVIDDVVISVDDERRTARVRLLEGLLPEGADEA